MIIQLLFIITGYLLGSVLFSRIIPKKCKNIDVCEVGKDHNPGAANVFSSCGIALGMICLALDIAKGALPVYLAEGMTDTNSILFAGIIAAPVIGHAFSVFNHFKGGKCIATSFGVSVALWPISHVFLILAGLYILLSTLVKISPACLRSIITFGLFGVSSGALLFYQGKYAVAFGCISVAMIAIIKHTKSLSAPHMVSVKLVGMKIGDKQKEIESTNA